MENEPKIPTPDTSPEAEAELDEALSRLEAPAGQPASETPEEELARRSIEHRIPGEMTLEEVEAAEEFGEKREAAEAKFDEAKTHDEKTAAAEELFRLKIEENKSAAKLAEEAVGILRNLDTYAVFAEDKLVGDLIGKALADKKIADRLTEVGTGKSRLVEIAKESLASALEDKMAGERDEDMVSRLEKTIDALRSERKAA